MCPVELNQAMSGREGAHRRPFPPHPLTWLTLCHCDVVRDQQQKRGHFYRVNDGDISIES
jgi:hypothetical protein